MNYIYFVNSDLLAFCSDATDSDLVLYDRGLPMENLVHHLVIPDPRALCAGLVRVETCTLERDSYGDYYDVLYCELLLDADTSELQTGEYFTRKYRQGGPYATSAREFARVRRPEPHPTPRSYDVPDYAKSFPSPDLLPPPPRARDLRPGDLLPPPSGYGESPLIAMRHQPTVVKSVTETRGGKIRVTISNRSIRGMNFFFLPDERVVFPRGHGSSSSANSLQGFLGVWRHRPTGKKVALLEHEHRAGRWRLGAGVALSEALASEALVETLAPTTPLGQRMGLRGTLTRTWRVRASTVTLDDWLQLDYSWRDTVRELIAAKVDESFLGLPEEELPFLRAFPTLLVREQLSELVLKPYDFEGEYVESRNELRVTPRDRSSLSSHELLIRDRRDYSRALAAAIHAAKDEHAPEDISEGGFVCRCGAPFRFEPAPAASPTPSNPSGAESPTKRRKRLDEQLTSLFSDHVARAGAEVARAMRPELAAQFPLGVPELYESSESDDSEPYRPTNPSPSDMDADPELRAAFSTPPASSKQPEPEDEDELPPPPPPTTPLPYKPPSNVSPTEGVYELPKPSHRPGEFPKAVPDELEVDPELDDLTPEQLEEQQRELARQAGLPWPLTPLVTNTDDLKAFEQDVAVRELLGQNLASHLASSDPSEE